MCTTVLKNITVMKNKVGGHEGKMVAIRKRLVKVFLQTQKIIKVSHLIHFASLIRSFKFANNGQVISDALFINN